MVEERRCRLSWCNKLLIRKENESPGEFKKRKTCGHECANQLPKKNRKKGKNFVTFREKEITPYNRWG